MIIFRLALIHLNFQVRLAAEVSFCKSLGPVNDMNKVPRGAVTIIDNTAKLRTFNEKILLAI